MKLAEHFKILAIKSRKWLERADLDPLPVLRSQRSNLVRISKYVQAAKPPRQALRRCSFTLIRVRVNQAFGLKRYAFEMSVALQLAECLQFQPSFDVISYPYSIQIIIFIL